MAQDLLKVEHLAASVEDTEILKDVSLHIGRGETHVIMGPNGAGKSTLAGVLMGNPAYTVTGGSALWEGEDLLDLSVSERAKKGLFLSFQNPVEVPGISLENFVRSALSQKTGKPVRVWSFRKEVKAALETLDMDQSYAERDLNVGFSGGEKKKAEIRLSPDHNPQRGDPLRPQSGRSPHPCGRKDRGGRRARTDRQDHGRRFRRF